MRAAKGVTALYGVPFFEDLRTGQRSSAQFVEWYHPRSTREHLRVMSYAWGGGRLVNLDQVHYLQYMEQFIMELGAQRYESTDYFARAEEVLDAVPWHLSVVTRALTEATVVHFASLNRRIAELRAIETVLALKMHHAEHGSYPKSLDGLSPADWVPPTDPFDGQPLRYRCEGQGFAVWSVGPDLTDDSAATDYYDLDYAARRSRRYNYDIVFRCER